MTYKRNERPETGLNQKEVLESRQKYGENLLPRAKRKSFLGSFFSNMSDPVIRILLVALAVNAVFSFRGGNWIETAGIAVAVFLATLISTASEYSSESAFRRLEEESSKESCRVRREGKVTEIPVRDVVVGDILLLSSGEKAAADGFMLSGKLGIDQSAMTGESRELEKFPNGERNPDPASPSAIFRGCPIVSGQGEIVVSAVGGATFLGEISREIGEQTRESPLRVRLSKLAKQISRIGYVLALFVALAYLFSNIVIESGWARDVIVLKLSNPAYLFSTVLSAFTLGLTVLVMSVPEGLPMMVAVVLASNLRKMSKDNVLVRKAVGIEAAGSMNILFTDKTGTLTEGKPVLGSLFLGDGTKLSSPSELSGELRELFELSCIYNGESVITDSGTVGGNATDKALLTSLNLGSNPHPDYEVIKKAPFDSTSKCSSVTLGGKRKLDFIKGAPEKLLPSISGYIDACGRTQKLSKNRLSSLLRDLTGSGSRMILIAARREHDSGPVLLCAAELHDKIRAEARASVADLSGAGIQVVMITGDARETARHIAKECSIINGERDLCLTSDELARLSDAKLREILPRLAVVARALPSDKSRLVRVSQEADLVVGMTGDGVNDAPALRRADVGFAMGSGTQVAREAGDIIILDNNLSSIVKAVLYGRTVFKSIRKFITLQLTMNLCACGISMIGPFIGYDSPVTVVQMLWINMIMDTLGGLAFAGEPALPEYMKENPKRRDEPILNGYMINSLLLSGGFMLSACVAFLTSPTIISHFRHDSSSVYLLTAFFAFFIFSSVLSCFGARTDRLNPFAGLAKNRAFLLIISAVCAIQIGFIYLGGSVLRSAPLTPEELSFTLLLSLSVVPAEFLRKLIWRTFRGKRGY